MTEAPEQLHLHFRRAFNRHDLDAVVALYEPEAILVGPGAPAVGREAIRALYQHVFAAQPTIELETLSVNQVGDLAMLHGRWQMRRAANDAEQTSEGRNTEVARLQSDGRWLFVIDHPFAP